MKNHSRHLYACGIFGLNALNAARFAAFICAGSSSKWSGQLPESSFQTCSGERNLQIINKNTYI
ncbi:hypothetical protein D3Z50_17260 [Clostridiaceae bacterium]|nr:hypothetical protein [Clostridiaceae bacterium]